MSRSTTMNRRQLIDGVMWEGKPVRVLLLAALVPLALGLVGLAGLGLPRAVTITLGVALTLFVLAGYGLYQYRKLSVGPHGLVFHGLFRTRGLRWEQIAAVEAKLRIGAGDSPSYAVVRCTLRDGSRQRHTINFLAEENLPYLALDLDGYAVPRGVVVQVTGSDSAVRAVHALRAASYR